MPGTLPISRTHAGGKYIDFSKFEVIDQPLWDSLNLTGTTSFSSQVLFQQARGQGGKTAVDTNMEAAGLLSAPKNQLVTGISVVTNADLNITDLKALTNQGVFTFTIADKQIFNLPVHMLGKAMLSGFAGSALFDYAALGAPGVRHGYKLRYPFVIPTQQSFQVTISMGTPIAGVISNLKLWVYLHGIQTRAIK